MASIPVRLLGTLQLDQSEDITVFYHTSYPQHGQCRVKPNIGTNCFSHKKINYGEQKGGINVFY